MAHKVAPSERTSKQLFDLLNGNEEAGDLVGKRRTKVIPHHVNERGALKLVYGTLIRASKRWQNVAMPSICPE